MASTGVHDERSPLLSRYGVDDDDDMRAILAAPSDISGVSTTDAQSRKNETRLLSTACILTTFFFFVELIGGYFAGSLAVMSDAAHLLSDLAGFFISLLALSISHLPANEAMSFGFARAEVLGAFLSILFIWALTIVLICEALRRMFSPTPVNGPMMILLGCAGLTVNLVLGLVLGHSHGEGGHSHHHGHSDGHGHGMAHIHEHDQGHGQSHTPSNVTNHNHDNTGHNGSCSQTQTHSHSISTCTSPSASKDRALQQRADPEISQSATIGSDGISTATEGRTVLGVPMNDPVYSREHNHVELPIASESGGSSDGRENHAHSHDHAHLGVHSHDNGHVTVSTNSGKGWWEKLVGGHGIESMNVRAAYLHVLGDALQNVGVITAAIIITIKPSWSLIDPLCTLLFAVIVVMTTKDLARDAFFVLMEGTPPSLSLNEVYKALIDIPHVIRIGDLHIWSITGRRSALSAHVFTVGGQTAHDVLKAAQRVLVSRFGIDHVTIQINCDEIDCCDDSHVGRASKNCVTASVLENGRR